MANILLVEDDVDFAESILAWMSGASYKVKHVSSGEEAIQLLGNSVFDIIIVDWELPGISGYEVVHSLRKQGIMTPVIYLTGRSDMLSKLTGLDGGADDYIVKPVNPHELCARINARMRRHGPQLPSTIIIGDATLDTVTGRVLIKGQETRLSRLEFAVLEFLMRHTNKIHSAKSILTSVWVSSSDSSEGAVRQMMYALRRKLAHMGAANLIKTIPGGGYIVENDE